MIPFFSSSSCIWISRSRYSWFLLFAAASSDRSLTIPATSSIQDCIDRFCPVLWLKVQRDYLFINLRILQPCQEIRQIIDRDSLPPKSSLFKVPKIMFQEDACTTKSVPCRTSIVPELQVLQYRVCPVLVFTVTLCIAHAPFFYSHEQYYTNPSLHER